MHSSTAFKQFRWQFVGNRFKDLDKSLRKKYIKEAIDAAVPKSVIEELKSLDALYPSGKIKDFTLFDNQSKKKNPISFVNLCATLCSFS